MLPDEFDIQKYLHADRVIDRLGQERKQAEVSLYSRTLETHIEFDEDRIHTVAPRIDSAVCDAIAQADGIDQQITRWQLRRKWFNAWLGTLGENERLMLTEWPQYAAQSLKDAAQDEIYQIETAVAYRCGYEPPEEHVDIPDDPAASVEAMAAFLGDD